METTLGGQWIYSTELDNALPPPSLNRRIYRMFTQPYSPASAPSQGALGWNYLNLQFQSKIRSNLGSSVEIAVKHFTQNIKEQVCDCVYGPVIYLMTKTVLGQLKFKPTW